MDTDQQQQFEKLFPKCRLPANNGTPSSTHSTSNSHHHNHHHNKRNNREHHQHRSSSDQQHHSSGTNSITHSSHHGRHRKQPKNLIIESYEASPTRYPRRAAIELNDTPTHEEPLDLKDLVNSLLAIPGPSDVECEAGSNQDPREKRERDTELASFLMSSPSSKELLLSHNGGDITSASMSTRSGGCSEEESGGPTTVQLPQPPPTSTKDVLTSPVGSGQMSPVDNGLSINGQLDPISDDNDLDCDRKELVLNHNNTAQASPTNQNIQSDRERSQSLESSENPLQPQICCEQVKTNVTTASASPVSPDRGVGGAESDQEQNSAGTDGKSLGDPFTFTLSSPESYFESNEIESEFSMSSGRFPVLEDGLSPTELSEQEEDSLEDEESDGQDHEDIDEEDVSPDRASRDNRSGEEIIQELLVDTHPGVSSGHKSGDDKSSTATTSAGCLPKRDSEGSISQITENSFQGGIGSGSNSGGNNSFESGASGLSNGHGHALSHSHGPSVASAASHVQQSPPSVINSLGHHMHATPLTGPRTPGGAIRENVVATSHHHHRTSTGDDDCDTDQETDRLLGMAKAADTTPPPPSTSKTKAKSTTGGPQTAPPPPSTTASREVLIEGVLFRARYLGSTQLICEGQPTKATRMMQAEEAVSRIRSLSAVDGETHPSTEVDLFISTEKIMVLNTDLKEIMMDHALRTISYIADIGDLLVLMARRRMGANGEEDPHKIKRIPKMICHVFESEEAQFIAQSIGQAFQVAYMEFLKANGIEDSSFVKEMDYQDVLNSQEIFGDELDMFANKSRQKEVIVPKQKNEILGMVVVESGWGSMLPTVVIANMAHGSPASRCGALNIGDQIIAINGVSLVGLPLSQCQHYIKNTKTQTAVKLTVAPCPPVVQVKIKRPDTKYQLGFSVQNGVICSLLRGGIAERGGVRVGHRIIEINGQSVVAVPHERIVNLLATSVGEITMKTMPTSMFRLLTGQETPVFI